MAQGDRADDRDESAGVPDARLTELLRARTAAAYPALREIRRRHHDAVLGYARLCASSDSSARQLAAQTFTTLARETARGVEPQVPLRHQLLLLTCRSAASWAGDERSAGLDPGLLLVLNTTAAPNGPTPALLAPFRALPSRTQGLIWYGVVEQEAEESTAALLGLTREDVRYGIPQALQAMAQACLKHRLAASDDPQCGDFRRLIEESVRPDTPRYSSDLHTHMAHCAHCTAAYEDLTALRDAPRAALAEGLLPWAGTAYARTAAPAAEADGPQEEPQEKRSRPPTRRVVLTSVALGVAMAPLLVFALAQSGSHGRRPTATTLPPSSPPVTVTATVSAPSPSPTSKSPSPTKTSHPPKTPSATPKPRPKPKPKPTPSPTPSAPGSAYAEVVNVATGRCLDVRDGDFENGTDVVTVRCDGTSSQRWRVDTDRQVVQSAGDPDFCLDSRGDVDRGVGIWGCDSVYGRNGDNLRFTVDSDGVIRPAIAVETAVTPDRGYGVSLDWLSGDADQRWRAGAR
ncbi:RICIN domain-containing protein [Streptomyces sp. HUAS TT20]|uniref:RICIN domain-containing protein n=1 Tax=Streptomyces sp. HUAS TT20 TaxID=3447509 RepID=UPI0021D802E5|nr:RICIN domain-containing protein [Streptomyces sp. HUAS 15-9]UXY27986.1 RICIN domain-containing protein [Streptomyces sp. HUAS 15-9]